MASPSPDGAAVTKTFGNTATAVLPALTTTVSNDDIFVVVASTQNTPVPSITTVTSAHLTFAFYARHEHPSASPSCAVEVWHAKAVGILTSEVITVNVSAPESGGLAAAFGMQGCTSKVFDPNGSLPASADGTGATTISGVSTTLLDDLLVIVQAFTSQPAPPGPSTWTSLVNTTDFSGGSFSSLNVFYKSVSAAQSGLTITSATGAGNYAELVFALTSDVVTVNPASQAIIVG